MRLNPREALLVEAFRRLPPDAAAELSALVIAGGVPRVRLRRDVKNQRSSGRSPVSLAILASAAGPTSSLS
jgi:hypothetical protein